MELNVTHIVAAHLNGNPPACICSGSRAELGDNAGALTWNNSRNLGASLPDFLTTEEEKQEVRDHFKSYGAWDAEEIAAWDDDDLRGLITQEVMSQIRHLEGSGLDLENFTEDEYREATENEGGSLYRGDIAGDESFGQWFLYVGN
jgi:hypothetical protein